MKIVNELNLDQFEEFDSPISVTGMLGRLREERNEGENNVKYTQWSQLSDGKLVPALSTRSRIKAGIYELSFSHQHDNIVLNPKPLNTDELYLLPSKEITEITEDIKTFWKSKEIFKKYKYVHKRGILLYGEPGCGKSGILQICMNTVINEMDGFVINIKNDEDIDLYVKYISTIRQIEPDRPLVVILEDIDSIVSEDKYSTSQVLNVLDGIKQIDNVVYIATTNYPEKLEERVSSRPSRFDRRYEIDFPSADIRRVYLENKLGADHKDIAYIVKNTEGMSLAHLKEVVISTVVFGNTLEEAFTALGELKTRPKIKGKQKPMGFGNK